MTYRPGDTFIKKLPLTEEGVSVTATVERNGSTESGTGITSLVSGQICTVTMAIPDTWEAGDHVSITLTATLDDETSYEVVEFMLESRTISELASQSGIDALPTTIRAELSSEFDGLGTLAKQEEILSAIEGIEPGGGSGTMAEQVEYIYDKFTQLPPERPALVLPAASAPGTVVLAVALRDGSQAMNGKRVTVSMYEPGIVYLDGAYEVDKSYSTITGNYTDEDGTVHQGMALIELFSSEKLEAAGYNGLYKVEAPGVRRDVWIPAGGGELGQMGTAKPEV